MIAKLKMKGNILPWEEECGGGGEMPLDHDRDEIVMTTKGQLDDTRVAMESAMSALHESRRLLAELRKEREKRTVSGHIEPTSTNSARLYQPSKNSAGGSSRSAFKNPAGGSSRSAFNSARAFAYLDPDDNASMPL